MIVIMCDGPACEERIIPAKFAELRWYGVDEAQPSKDDDDDEVEWCDSDDYGAHFCSPRCLTAWAMDRDYANH